MDAGVDVFQFDQPDAYPAEVLAKEITVGDKLEFSKEWNINGETVTVSVEKVK